MLVPQIMKGDVDGSQQNSVGEQIGAVPVHQIWEPIGEGVQLAPQERVQNHTQEQIVDVPAIMEAPVDVVCSTPQERDLAGEARRRGWCEHELMYHIFEFWGAGGAAQHGGAHEGVGFCERGF